LTDCKLWLQASAYDAGNQNAHQRTSGNQPRTEERPLGFAGIIGSAAINRICEFSD